MVGQNIYSQILAFGFGGYGAWGARTWRTFSSTSFTQELNHLGGLLFRVSGLKHKGHVMVRLQGNDLYYISIGKLSKGTWIEKTSKTDIYCEDLVRVIDSLVEGTLELSPQEARKVYQEALS